MVGWVLLFALPWPAAGQEYRLLGTRQVEQPQVDAQVLEVAEGLRAWEQSFENLWLVTVGFDRTSKADKSNESSAEAEVDEGDWEQRTSFWYHDPFTLGFQHDWLVQGKSEYRVKGAAEGFRYWLAASEDGNPEVFSRRQSQPLQFLASPAVHALHPHPLQSQCRIAALRGLWWSPGCQWLGDKLPEVYGIHFVGTELVDGRPCLVLSTGLHSKDRMEDGVQMTWYFDPELQYLPRRFKRTEISQTGEQEDFDQVWQVTEFRKTDEGIWFPGKGFIRRRYRSEGHKDQADLLFEWTVLEVQLNKQKPAELMQPPPETGNESTDENQIGAQGDILVADELQPSGVWSSESGRQFADGLREQQKRQTAKDAFSLLLILTVTGAAVITMYLGYQKLVTGSHQSSA